MDPLLELFAQLERIGRPAVLATLLRADGPGLRRILGEAEAAGPAQAVLASGRSRTVAMDLDPAFARFWPGLDGAVLLEPMIPGRLPPWLHFCTQQLKRGGGCVLATVAAVAGALPYAVGDRYGYDDRDHGLLPMDGRFSLELHRACQRVRAATHPIRERFPFPGGSLELILEPLGPRAALAAPAP